MISSSHPLSRPREFGCALETADGALIPRAQRCGSPTEMAPSSPALPNEKERTVYLFVCLPMAGHLRPTLAVARALHELLLRNHAASHHAVLFAALEADRAVVEAAHVPFLSLGELSADDEARVAAARASPAAAAWFAAYEVVLYPKLMRAAAALSPPPPPPPPPMLSPPQTPRLVVVADFATHAALDAADALGAPLAVLWHVPLTIALTLGCEGSAALLGRRDAPLEFPDGFNATERGGSGGFCAGGRWCVPLPLLCALRVLHPVLKRVAHCRLAGHARAARAQGRSAAGLPPQSAGGGCAPWGVGAGVPRALHLVNGTPELDAAHLLPPGWELTGPQGLGLGGAGAGFPATFGVRDAKLELFLDAAKSACVPVVYVATGTLVQLTRRQAAALAGAISMLAGAAAEDADDAAARSGRGAPVRFVWSLPQACHALLPSSFRPASGRVVLLPYAPQVAVLCHPAVRLFVTHGGLSSVHEGLTAGKPLLVLPFFGDQPVNACHVVNKGVGAALDPRNLRAGPLARALRALLRDAGAAERAAALGKRLRAGQPGAERAAQLLLEFGGVGALEEA